ncbi:unnamed protein product [Lampetra planeri]
MRSGGGLRGRASVARMAVPRVTLPRSNRHTPPQFDSILRSEVVETTRPSFSYPSRPKPRSVKRFDQKRSPAGSAQMALKTNGTEDGYGKTIDSRIARHPDTQGAGHSESQRAKQLQSWTARQLNRQAAKQPGS